MLCLQQIKNYSIPLIPGQDSHNASICFTCLVLVLFVFYLPSTFTSVCRFHAAAFTAKGSNHIWYLFLKCWHASCRSLSVSVMYFLFLSKMYPSCQFSTCSLRFGMNIYVIFKASFISCTVSAIGKLVSRLIQ